MAYPSDTRRERREASTYRLVIVRAQAQGPKRYIWEIHHADKAYIKRAKDSYSSMEEAHAKGSSELQRLLNAA
jgi:hypothetical protein